MTLTASTTSQSSGPAALQALLEASAMLLASSSSNEVLSGILGMAQNVISADAYALWRSTDAVHWHVEGSRGLPPDYRRELISSPDFIPRFEAIEDVQNHPSISTESEVYRRHGIRSLLIVPLQLQNPSPLGPNRGTLTFYWREPRRFTDLDVAYASALANLSSAALNLAELNEQSRRERSRLTFLAEASAALSSSLDYEATLDRVANLAVRNIADWCIVHILESDVPTRIVVAHADPAQLARAREFSDRYPEKIVLERGLGLVLRTGRPEFHPVITDEMIAQAADDEDRLHRLREFNLSGSILVPLLAHDNRVLGAIRLLATNGRTFRDDDLRLAEDLARRAATAIENAQLHREVVRQENRLRLAHAAARMGTWSWDLVRNELDWSDEWRRLHDLPLEMAAEPDIGASLVHPDDRQQVMAQLSAAIASNDLLVVFEHRVITPAGRNLWAHHRARIERDAEGRATAILGITMDITERRKAEEALRRSEKLAAAGRLAATVAHEINNPLESIVNLIYIAKLTPSLPPEAAELLETAEGELNRTAQIVRQTLGFYRESVHPQRSNIGLLILDLLALYRSRVQSRALTCRAEIEPEVFASVIPGELKQVAANLISNAIDATGPGGSITVSVSRNHTQALIQVRDTGTGIDEAHLVHVFEPFFTTKADVGTGLGLWVSKGIIEKHDGEISVETSTAADDHGTTFTISLPLAPEPHTAAAPSAAAAASLA